MHCHAHSHDLRFDVVLVGNPNVGKSVIFHRLTGKYADVSNYPGTTVDILTGKIKGTDLKLADLPGMYSFFSITEEEKVAREILLFSNPKVVVNIVDAKNLERGLTLTFQLFDCGFNMILVLNAVDEAEKLGIKINEKELEKELGIPVIKTVAVKGEGIKELVDKIKEVSVFPVHTPKLRFSEETEKAVREVTDMIENDLPINKRIMAILALTGDEEILKTYNIDKELIERYRLRFGVSPAYRFALEYQRMAEELVKRTVRVERKERSLYDWINNLTLNPITAIPMSLIALYFLYLLAGVVGAQIMVDYIEEQFESIINTNLNSWLEQNVPYYWVRELFGGEYGIITLGLRYAIAIIFPIVTMFFLAFAILEDSGFLPRMAMLLDKLFKKFGLSGRSVIPLVLGLGCGTMAVIVTRVLESRRERMIATLMLAVAIPCSAQLGIMLGIAPDFKALTVWAASVFSVLMVIGVLAGKYMPGQEPVFYMEIPSLRLPSISNILMKTVSRLEWYFREVIPIFIAISLAIWAGRITGIFDVIVSALAVPSSLLGLPEKMGEVFLYGFFRRDYGTAGLYDLVSQGILDYKQTLISMVVLTLFVPCIAQFSMMTKERGLRFAAVTVLTAILIAFSAGMLLKTILGWIS